MKNQLHFPYPFSGFNSISFSNCFASVYMYLEGITGTEEHDCAKKEGKNCDGCGNCHGSTSNRQEDFYFLFDTLSGRSSMRPNFDNTPEDIDENPESIDFLFKFTGYDYFTAKDSFAKETKRSIDSGKPVIARVKDRSNGAFRVLTGYDGNLLIMADPANAQKKPETPTYDDISEIIIITEKTQSVYTLTDGLKRIQTIMENNKKAKVWDAYIQQFMYWNGKLQDVDFEEIKRRFKRISDISWYNFSCHNFAEVFRHRIIDSLKDIRLDEVCRQIDESYDNSHTRNWQIISLNDCRDWSSRRYNELEWGYCTCVVQCLEKLKEYDSEVLGAIKKAIQILS